LVRHHIRYRNIAWAVLHLDKAGEMLAVRGDSQAINPASERLGVYRRWLRRQKIFLWQPDGGQMRYIPDTVRMLNCYARLDNNSTTELASVPGDGKCRRRIPRPANRHCSGTLST
jgi:hypothetical protein